MGQFKKNWELLVLRMPNPKETQYIKHPQSYHTSSPGVNAGRVEFWGVMLGEKRQEWQIGNCRAFRAGMEHMGHFIKVPNIYMRKSLGS